ncbi:MAG TPA: hypothetical protein VJ983_10885, partial [candidate division Zixibacteria bacterium]|nr:hypothetical protein [candidate division Zixibacteria bacterium]
MKIVKLISLVAVLAVMSLSTGYAQDDNETCLSCHSDKDLVGVDHQGNEVSVFVNAADIDSSVHAGMNCIDCH